MFPKVHTRLLCVTIEPRCLLSRVSGYNALNWLLLLFYISLSSSAPTPLASRNPALREHLKAGWISQKRFGYQVSLNIIKNTSKFLRLFWPIETFYESYEETWPKPKIWKCIFQKNIESVFSNTVLAEILFLWSVPGIRIFFWSLKLRFFEICTWVGESNFLQSELILLFCEIHIELSSFKNKYVQCWNTCISSDQFRKCVLGLYYKILF